ncbi:MAG: FAD-binding oxidoreductase [Pseudomonadota bacterium]|nr:FAD-binding oxidoreductase [Pseudomonadota bacterium]
MSLDQNFQPPQQQRYDVVIVGGAMYGSSIAWWTASNPDFDGSILVVERDPSYAFASTSHTNSCIRQQFTNEINVRISQFGAHFIRNFRDFMGGDERVPDIVLQSFGYLYLADNQAFADLLSENQQIQSDLGAGTRMLSREQIAALFPFYQLDDIIAGSHNPVDEGYFDGATIFDWWRRSARERGVEYCTNEVVGMDLNPAGSAVDAVRLATGETIACGQVVNASGPRAVETARMIGAELPVEPRKRYTFIFDAAEPLDQDLPLTIDPSGVHMRTDGRYYLAGSPPEEGDDPAVAYDDFAADHGLWENKVWPVLASRVPQFERIKLINSWVGHYAFNTLDQNAIIGPHSRVSNFLFSNGFSGHGFQQSPALGRGLSEWLIYGEYRNLDLSPFGFDRIEAGRPFLEKAVI